MQQYIGRGKEIMNVKSITTNLESDINKTQMNSRKYADNSFEKYSDFMHSPK